MSTLPKDFTPQQHLDAYVEFARLEKMTSGPGPHRKVAERLALESTDPAWAIGLYGMAYTTAGMEVLLHHYPDRDSWGGGSVRQLDLGRLIPRRDERVVNGFGDKRLEEMLISYRTWLYAGGLERAQSADSFDEAFRLVSGGLTHFGRFFGIKLYEALERTVGLPHFDDVRPYNGHWARRSLALFFPSHDPVSNGSLERNLANGYARSVQEYARPVVELSMFEVESMLCNYRQAVKGQKYPGGDVDGDQAYLLEGERRNPYLTFRSWAHRKEIVPIWARGESGDRWAGKRPLGTYFRDTGEWHTDLPTWRKERAS